MKNDQQLFNELNNLDYGYCNPIKSKMASEDALDIRQELKDRGYTDSEIIQEIFD